MTLDTKTRRRTRRGARTAFAASLAAGAGMVAALGFAGPASAATTAQLRDGTLQIRGDAASDKLALINAPTTFVLDVGEDGTADFTFDRATVTAVDIQGRAGDDDLVVERGGGASDTPITLDGGAGDDTLAGGDGADLLRGGPRDDVVDGNIRADVADLGPGDDHFRWDPGDGSDTIEGGPGHDSLEFNGSNAAETIDLSANGPRVRLFRNVAAITMDFDGVETTNVRALGSADTITVGDLTGTDLKLAHVDLGATDGTGDTAADRVITNGTARADRVAVTRDGAGVLVTGLPAQTRITGSEAANDALLVNTLAGADRVTVAPDVAGLMQPIVDLGPGQ